MKCKDCGHFRTDIKVFGGNAGLSSKYGPFVNACNRYPRNIMRAPKEPACGEFKPKGAKDNEVEPSTD